MKQKKRLTFVVMCVCSLVLALTGNTLSADETLGVSEDKITIGSIAPLTGAIAMVGVPIANAIKDYFSHINEQGGIYGRMVDVISEDGKYDPPSAIASLKKLINRDKIFACASTSGTPITWALNPTITREKLPSMVPIPSYGIFGLESPKYLFSYGPYYAEQVAFNIEHILFTLKAKDPRIAFFYQDDEFGQDGNRGFKAAVEKYSLNVVATEKYTRGAIDISSQVLNIKRAKPDFLIITAIPSHSILLLKEAKKQGLNIPIFSCANARLEAVIKVTGDAAEHYYCAEYTALPNETHIPGMTKLIEVRNKRSPESKVPPKYHILSYVNALILGEGLQKAGRDLTREKLRDALESIKDFDTEGLTGPISFSPTDHCPLTAMRVVKANPKTGFYDAVTDWGMPKLDLRKN